MIYGRYLYDPNGVVFTFGGDGYILYYNMIYHTLFGDGILLESMNYPRGEVCFLTDMQASLSILLNQIHHHLIPLDDKVVGITHALLLYLLPVAAIFIYHIFKILKVRDLLAIVFSILITFLSPQIVRIAGHFGLGYLFLIPMCIWWVLFQMSYNRKWYYIIPVALILLFFSLNNPYIGFMTCSFLCLAGMIVFILYPGKVEFSLFRSGSYLFLSGMIPLAISLITIKFLDPFDDRIEIQWGYFYFQTKLGTLFFPPGSLLHDWLSGIMDLRRLDTEQVVNIGLASTTILFVSIITSIVRKNASILHVPRPFQVCLISGFALLLYSMGFPFFPIIKSWAEENMNLLLMLKATSRCAWPMYYLLTILAVFYLNRYLNFVRSHNFIWTGYLTLTIVSMVWGYEAYRQTSRTVEGKFYTSPFRQSEFDHLNRILSGNRIDKEEYQGIFLLPLVQGWSDKLYTELDFAAHFHGMRMSLASGLPLINAMLSRIPLSSSTSITQMVSHPLIEKKAIRELDPSRKILILRGGKSPLKVGEMAFIDQADTLYESKEFSLYEMQFPNEKLETEINQAKQYYLQNLQKKTSSPVYYLGYNGMSSQESFYGSGSKELQTGQQSVAEFYLDQKIHPDSLEFSVWVKLDNRKYGLPIWQIQQIDSSTKVIDHQTIETRKSHEIQHGWIRASSLIFIKSDAQRIRIQANNNQKFTIDELMIRNPKDSILFDSDLSPYISFNNYLVAYPE